MKQPRSPRTSKRPPLSARLQAFCDAYRGNITQAAIAAGCPEKSAHTTGWRWLQKAEVKAEIARQQSARSKASIMSREQMQKELSEIASDRHAKTRDRLAAMSLLGKTRGDFSDNINLKGELTVHELVREALEKPPE